MVILGRMGRAKNMTTRESLNQRRMALNTGSARIPALGFGTLIADPDETRRATKTAVEAGFRHFDCAERYRNEDQVGAALKAAIADGTVRREDLFVTTKLWNNNHRPERVKPALQASLDRLGLDSVDLYLVHTPFAFEPGDEQDPRDQDGAVIYDDGVTLEDTWAAMETVVDEGLCRSIGISDFDAEAVRRILTVARIKPAVLQVESHPYLPQWDLLDLCNAEGIVLLAFASLGHALEPSLLEDPLIVWIARRTGQSPAQVLLAWGVQRGTAILTTSTKPDRIRESYGISALPGDAMNEINHSIETRYRFNSVVEAGVPGFIPRGR